MIKEEVLDKVFINRNETNQINQDLCAQSIDLTLEKVGEVINEWMKENSDYDINEGQIQKLKEKIGVKESNES